MGNTIISCGGNCIDNDIFSKKINGKRLVLDYHSSPIFLGERSDNGYLFFVD
jgi:hypothetical protein